jgi:ketosteroid isomerase-like protein
MTDKPAITDEPALEEIAAPFRAGNVGREPPIPETTEAEMPLDALDLLITFVAHPNRPTNSCPSYNRVRSTTKFTQVNLRQFIGKTATFGIFAFWLSLFGNSRALTADTTNDESQIRSLENRLAAAFKAKDLDGIMANYQHSKELAFFDVVPRHEYLGWDAYKKDWQGFFALIDGPFALFEIKDLSVKVDGDLAYSYSFQHSVAKTKAGGSRDVTVRVTDVYRKSDGKWLIVQEHVSVPVVNPTD